METKNDLNQSKYARTMRVYEKYCAQINPQTELRNFEMARIGRRLDEFGEDKLCEAIDRFHGSNWWMNHHSFRCAGWFFKKEKIKRFLEIQTKEERKQERESFYPPVGKVV